MVTRLSCSGLDSNALTYHLINLSFNLNCCIPDDTVELLTLLLCIRAISGLNPGLNRAFCFFPDHLQLIIYIILPFDEGLPLKLEKDY